MRKPSTTTPQLRSYDGVYQVLDEARQLHAAGQLFENVREEEGEVTEPVAMLAEPGEQDTDDLETNVSTEHTEDVDRDHLRDPEVKWLEPPVGGTGEVPSARDLHRSDSPVIRQIFLKWKRKEMVDVPLRQVVDQFFRVPKFSSQHRCHRLFSLARFSGGTMSGSQFWLSSMHHTQIDLLLCFSGDSGSLQFLLAHMLLLCSVANHHQEWSLRLNLTQQRKTLQVLTV